MFPFVVSAHPKGPPEDFLAIVFRTVKFTFHAVQKSLFLMFEICRCDHSYLSQDFLTAVKVAVPACLLGSQWQVSQGICYTASMGILDKRSCDECPSHGLEVQISSLRSTLECVKS